MLFAEIIRNAGLATDEFQNCANIQTYLYDGKDRVSSEESVHFFEPFFKENEDSLKNFKIFLTGIEKETIESINVKVDIDSVILFYKTPRAIVFMRRPSIDPLDCMD